jgi:hypothetical protein
VKIRNFANKGLKRLYAEDSAKGVPSGASLAMPTVVFSTGRD